MEYIFACSNESELIGLRDHLMQLFPVKPLVSGEIRWGDMTVRTANVLKAEGITTYAQLCGYSGWDLMKLPNFGRLALNDVNGHLIRVGLRLMPDTKSSPL